MQLAVAVPDGPRLVSIS